MLAIAVRAVLLAIVAAAALVAHRRRRSILCSLLFVVIGLFICAYARHIEYPVAQFLYCLSHPQTSSVGFWRIPEAGFWSVHTDWIAPALGVAIGAVLGILFTRHAQRAA